MPQIDFYVLSEIEPYRFICRLLEKAYQRGNSALVYVESVEVARQLDELLWTSNDSSFIPHALATDSLAAADCPIVITHSDPVEKTQGILFNLTSTIPEFHHQYPRIIECVLPEESWKKVAREHYRYYQQQHYPIKTHQI